MILTLEVIGEQAQDLGAGGRKVFNAIGGTIGRLPDNDWVFPDPYVSGRHALIRYLNGKYFIEDTSTNGVFVNTPDNRISRTESHQLHDGDVVYIDAYQIKVTIAKDPEAAEERRSVRATAGARQRAARARFRRRVRRRRTTRIAREPWSKRPARTARRRSLRRHGVVRLERHVVGPEAGDAGCAKPSRRAPAPAARAHVAARRPPPPAAVRPVPSAPHRRPAQRKLPPETPRS